MKNTIWAVHTSLLKLALNGILIFLALPIGSYAQNNNASNEKSRKAKKTLSAELDKLHSQLK